MRRGYSYGWTILVAALMTVTLAGCGRSSYHVGVGSGFVGTHPPACPSYYYGHGYGYGYGHGYRHGVGYSKTTVYHHHHFGSHYRGGIGHHHGFHGHRHGGHHRRGHGSRRSR